MDMRIMGLDFGSRAMGMAVSDTLGLIAQGVETITGKGENRLRQTPARVETLIGEYEIETIALDYPKNINDTMGERAKRAEEFKIMLERRTELPVILWDERLTTMVTEEISIENGVRGEHRKKAIDKIAAGIIL